MGKTDTDTTIAELKQEIIAFAAARGWDKHHTPKGLAISISLEAAELLEHYQWDDLQADEDIKKQQIADELADILTYVLAFADATDIDVATAYRAKLAKSARKYPTEVFNPANKNRDEYLKIKKRHRESETS